MKNKIGIVGAGSIGLIAHRIINAQGKEPERGILVVEDKLVNLNPTVPPAPITVVQQATPLGKNGWSQRPTAKRVHVQIGSYKFKTKKK